MTQPSSAANRQLSALRRVQLATALRNVQGEKRFGLYVLVNPEQDPAPRLAAVQALATGRQWTVAIRAIDHTRPIDPAVRPQLARLLTALRQREIHGVVAASRVDISDDDQYACGLLQRHGGRRRQALQPVLPAGDRGGRSVSGRDRVRSATNWTRT
ncbi:hypothetical protein OIE62_07025 [Streptomyces scopuliridis]|uniref:Uncharacterized protein n=1 Tax=Streptomyces scopuliridis TaxID=452529 RepID=A0ACD4ZXA4_9ACTN|nr:hypothetical protein [Streptomyces scopuliridis]WSC01672.1 hypothetical protein OG835_34795 [Streptomyces scopuliridis]WSC04789.1 hypothetical protein OIE62_07025 [Streptomyces scopuliridis]